MVRTAEAMLLKALEFDAKAKEARKISCDCGRLAYSMIRSPYQFDGQGRIPRSRVFEDRLQVASEREIRFAAEASLAAQNAKYFFELALKSEEAEGPVR